ncbi:MAG: hypothetical protein RBT64_15145 [Trichloromonas sp.]|nr:hypothetical protein [Trichloromonas sp.]
MSQSIRTALLTLIREIEVAGPVRGNWANYGKLGSGHLKKGRPTYVAVWEETEHSARSLHLI